MNIFKKAFFKIKILIKQIIKRDNVKLLTETDGIKNEEISKDIVNDEIKEVEQNIKTNDNNKNFFIIYNNFKKGIIQPSDLMISDLIKIQIMLIEENNIIDEKVKKNNNELFELKREVETLKNENELLNNKIKKSN